MNTKKFLPLFAGFMIFAAGIALPAYASESDGAEAYSNTVSYTIEKDQTYSFENIGIIEYDISGFNYSTDYVLYYADGSIKTYEANSSPGTITVPAGGKLKATSVSRTINLSLDDDNFIVNSENTPVMNRITVYKGETYTVRNIDNTAYEIKGWYANFDYILYDADGNITDYHASSGVGGMSIPAGYSIKLTCTESSSGLYLLYDKFTVEKNETPVMNRITVYKGETYTVRNIDNTAYEIKGWYANFDYILYDADGNITDYKSSRDVGGMSIPAGYSIKLTCTRDYYGSPSWLYLLYDKFTVEKNDTPVMNRITVYKGETYTVRNIDNTAYEIKGLYTDFDYILYDADGNITDYHASSGVGNMSIPAGYSIKLTCTRSDNSWLYLLYGKFTVEKTETPVMNRITVHQGETYTVRNIDNTAYEIKGVYANFDYILYDADGNITDYQSSGRVEGMSIPAGYSIKLTCTRSGNSWLYLLYDKFTVTQDAEPALLRVNIQKDGTYTYTNTSPIESTINGDRCNYIIYYANNVVKETVSDKSLSNVKIPAGGKIKVTAVRDDTDIYAPYELFEAEDGGTAYYTFEPGKSYVLTNNGTTDKTVSLNGGGSWYYVIYDVNNAYSSCAYHTVDKITLPKGAKAYITPNALMYNSIVKDDDMAVSEYNKSVYNNTKAEPNQIYKLTNNGGRDLNIVADGEAFDYVVCNAAGTVTSYKSHAADSSFKVPAGGYILISSPSAANYDSLSEYFTVEKSDGELFIKTLVRDNKTYKFTNTSVADYTLYIDGTYDYVVYKADNSVKEEAILHSGDLTVAVGCTAVITPCLGSINAHGLKTVFNVSERSYPVFMRAYVGIDGGTVFNNKSDENKYIYSVSGETLNYSTYDALGNVQDAKERETLNKLTVPANGSAKLRANLNGVDFAGLYECFTEGDFGVKVTGIQLSADSLTLAPNGQAVLRANITPADATNKAVTWSSSAPNVAAVAQTGKVTAKSLGTAIITATTADGGYSASCNVTVTDGSKPPEPIKPIEVSVQYEVNNINNSVEFTVTAKDTAESSKLADVILYAAEYDGDGKLTGIRLYSSKDINNDSITLSAHIPNGNRYSFMLWDKNNVPLTEAITDISAS